MKELTIGRLPSNDVVLDSPAVSREKHLLATIKPDHSIYLTHFGSNDTKLDDISIKKSPLHPEHSIKIGDFMMSGNELIGKINKVINNSRTDFSLEFQTLLSTLEEFETKKSKINKPSNIPKIIKVASTLSILLVLVVFPDAVPDTFRYPLIALSGVLATLFSGVGKNNPKKQNAIDDLEIEHHEILRCPKCRTLLMNTSSHKLRGLSKCINDRCDVIFSIN